ncbi:iron-sulfur cluster assembly protein [Rhizobium sp. RCAM05350]|nr:iron-sulfur cluster assembly protein [Rhizobium sp. RCAM05350]
MTVRAGDAVENMVRDALRIVIDPEIGRSVVDIGLIYNIVAREDSTMVIDMTTTTKGCPAAEYLVDAVRECDSRRPHRSPLRCAWYTSRHGRRI